MLLLAFDTSTRYASVALCSENELLSEYTWYAENNHSVDLLDRIQRSMAERQLSLSQLDAIAVATGPGSFNGVRVALSTAKALAFALQKPLIGIPTLELIAAQQQWRGLICAVLEAGRSELYAACYVATELRLSSGELSYHLEQLGDYLLCKPEQLVEALQEHLRDRAPAQASVLFCGEIKTVSWQAIQQGLGEQCLLRSAIPSTRHASILTQLAVQRLQAGQAEDPLLLEPLYLRRPSITKSTRKQPLLSGHLATTNGPYKTERE
jgi:tRNA threonylcarbamoyladenosine biosynthesis protein TsaB